MCNVLIACGSTHKRAHVQRLFRSFRRNNWLVQYIGWDRFREIDETSRKDGIELRYIQRGFGSGSWKMIFAVPLWAIHLFVHLLFHSPPDLVYGLDLDSALACAIVSRIWQVPFVYDIRDNFLIRHRWPQLIRSMLRHIDNWVMKEASIIVVVDENRIMGSLEQFKDKVIILYNCPRDIGEPPTRSDQHALSILVTGHISESRGINVLLDSLEHLSFMEVIMAGHIYEENIRTRVKHDPRIKYLGWVDQERVWSLGWESDVMYSCYAPTSEINIRAASNKWFDAMMAGIPILTNEEVLRSSWVREKDIGYLFPYNDVEALVDVLSYISAHPDDAQAKGKRGRFLFETEYNWELMEQRLMSAIHNVLEKDDECMQPQLGEGV